jgi:exonuclease SbcC
MIKSLHILNCQSHKDTFLEFHPGVNVIIGPTDSGKSAILRVIRWIVKNRPSGDTLRSWWGGKTIADMQTTEGRKIIRSRDKTDEYQLDTTVFKAFNTSVPEEIAQALNLNEINLQRQLDAPFLLSDSPGDVAQHFNRVAGLDKIDVGEQNINKCIRTINGDISSCGGLITQAEIDLKKFDHLDKFEAEVEVLEQMDKNHSGLVRSIARLTTIIGGIKDKTAKIDKVSQIVKLEPSVNQISTYIKERDAIKLKRTTLSNKIQSIKQYSQRLLAIHKTTELEPQVTSLLKLYEEKRRITSSRDALHQMIAKIKTNNILLTNVKNTSEALQKRFTENFPENCPLCNQKIEHSHETI